MRPGTSPAGSGNRRGRRRRGWARSTVDQAAGTGRPGGGWAASPSAPSRRRPLAVRSKGSLYSALFFPSRLRLSLADCRGKVVAITFIYASCVDACPLLTAKMAGLQKGLGLDFGPKVFFLSITVDPERDTPAVLRRYAKGHGVNPAGWAFLTGSPDEIREVARGYGIYYRNQAGGDVDHTFLTSVVDQQGILRVQYSGIRFSPDELLRDIQALVREGRPR